MRILHVSSLWPPSVLGGAELYAARLADELVARGHEVGVVTLGISGPGVVASVRPWPYTLDLYEQQPAWRRALFHLRDVYDPVAASTLRRAIASFRPDVVHTHSVAGLSASVLTTSAAAPVGTVHTVHDYWLLCRRASLVAASGRYCTRRCASCRVLSGSRSLLLKRRFASVVIAPSEAVARLHIEAWPWLEDRVVRIANPSDVPAQRPGAALVDGRDGYTRFGYLGRLTPTKGVRTLLRAFENLKAGKAELLVGGSGELATEVTASGPGVRFLGWLSGEARDDFFTAIDCVVVPSEWPEVGSLTTLEARQRLLPVIASTAGCLPEYVDEANRSLLYPAGDVDALTKSLTAFAADPERYRPVGPAPLTWPEYTDAVLGCYERAAAAAAPVR